RPHYETVAYTTLFRAAMMRDVAAEQHVAAGGDGRGDARLTGARRHGDAPRCHAVDRGEAQPVWAEALDGELHEVVPRAVEAPDADRKSTRLNSSHVKI